MIVAAGSAGEPSGPARLAALRFLAMAFRDDGDGYYLADIGGGLTLQVDMEHRRIEAFISRPEVSKDDMHRGQAALNSLGLTWNSFTEGVDDRGVLRFTAHF